MDTTILVVLITAGATILAALIGAGATIAGPVIAEIIRRRRKGAGAEPPTKDAPPDHEDTANLRVTQYEIIDAILGAYPYSRAGNWLSAERQVELLRLAYQAKLSDGCNAFPAMHGGAVRGDAPRSWDGSDRTNRMKTHVRSDKAIKADGRNLYMLAQGVTPADLGVSQTTVDALFTQGVIPWYDVGKATQAAPVG